MDVSIHCRVNTDFSPSPQVLCSHPLHTSHVQIMLPACTVELLIANCYQGVPPSAVLLVFVIQLLSEVIQNSRGRYLKIETMTDLELQSNVYEADIVE